MKNSQMLIFIGLFLWGFLQIPNSNAFSEINPIYNVNLAPFIQRLSAYYCLQNVSSDCPGNFTLKIDGWLNISASETLAFCDGGCAQHTQAVLKCVWYVKDDFKFENKATIKNLNDTIISGCAQGFSGTSLHQGNGGSGTTTSVITTLCAMAFLALFYI
ncbi:uncharacterized protein LOC112518004 [Cynara cardunculus var. scolymus]|uniref:DUF7731 domain-containing protein n=1 Tax=Cynara cardunculus var. scolymus TaxID=59895 RepID=A0A103XNK8_CYNCS|nr:uncharacterized protein LOC112518004 [Cynara cardunculus var. scolymus]KVH94126.1 hypothetical protein Ccrd_003798 [Cynara cardunculus var. scolymus]